jgi:hypothetical protein
MPVAFSVSREMAYEREASARAQEKSSVSHEQACNACLEKGRRRDRMRLYRLRAIIYVLAILAVYVVIWMYLPLSKRNR